MYYEKKKNSFLGFLIIAFLSIITIILVNLINRVDAILNIDNMETKETGTETVLEEFSVENLIENVSYSIVRSVKIKSKWNCNFYSKF
jgi:hypothetical protein